MKKHFLAICFLASIGLYAQVEKGSKLIGANISSFRYSSDKYTNQVKQVKAQPGINIIESSSKENDINIALNPNIAWFVIDKLAIGGTVGFQYNKWNRTETSITNISSSTFKSSRNSFSFSFGPFARYYFGNNLKGLPYIEADIRYGWGGYKYTTGDLDYGNFYSIRSSLNLGYEYFISEYIGLYGSLGLNYIYQNQTFEPLAENEGGTEKRTSKTINIPITIGVQIHLPAKCKE